MQITTWEIGVDTVQQPTLAGRKEVADCVAMSRCCRQLATVMEAKHKRTSGATQNCDITQLTTLKIGFIAECGAIAGLGG